MTENACLNCGKVFFSTKERKYCCTRCRRSHWSRTRYAELTSPCPYNEGVICTEPKCTNCGWHPKVAAARIAALMGR